MLRKVHNDEQDMLSKNKIKQIQALARKKGRRESGCFVAEGNKLVEDSWGAFECEMLLATSAWLERHPDWRGRSETVAVTPDEMQRASQLTTPQEVLAVFRMPDYRLDLSVLRSSLTLALDTVQDPGNLGTIVRIADWFGIRHILCSPESADLYNPKVVQATMGAIARVQVHYVDLPETLAALDGLPVYGTFLDGTNIYDEPLSDNGIVVMGNEGNGISAQLEPYIGRRLFVPSYPVGEPTSESLNVAVATAVVCAEFRRRTAIHL